MLMGGPCNSVHWRGATGGAVRKLQLRDALVESVYQLGEIARQEEERRKTEEEKGGAGEEEEETEINGIREGGETDAQPLEGGSTQGMEDNNNIRQGYPHKTQEEGKRRDAEGMLGRICETVLNNNYFVDMSSLQLLVNIKKLDLSCNLISEIEGLTGLHRLEWLALPYNRIQSLKGLQQAWGADYSLRYLDVRYNLLSNFHTLLFLGGLSNLHELRIGTDDEDDPDCNPICSSSTILPVTFASSPSSPLHIHSHCTALRLLLLGVCPIATWVDTNAVCEEERMAARRAEVDWGKDEENSENVGEDIKDRLKGKDNAYTKQYRIKEDNASTNSNNNVSICKNIENHTPCNTLATSPAGRSAWTLPKKTVTALHMNVVNLQLPRSSSVDTSSGDTSETAVNSSGNCSSTHNSNSSHSIACTKNSIRTIPATPDSSSSMVNSSPLSKKEPQGEGNEQLESNSYEAKVEALQRLLAELTCNGSRSNSKITNTSRGNNTSNHINTTSSGMNNLSEQQQKQHQQTQPSKCQDVEVSCSPTVIQQALAIRSSATNDTSSSSTSCNSNTSDCSTNVRNKCVGNNISIEEAAPSQIPSISSTHDRWCSHVTSPPSYSQHSAITATLNQTNASTFFATSSSLQTTPATAAVVRDFLRSESRKLAREWKRSRAHRSEVAALMRHLSKVDVEIKKRERHRAELESKYDEVTSSLRERDLAVDRLQRENDNLHSDLRVAHVQNASADINSTSFSNSASSEYTTSSSTTSIHQFTQTSRIEAAEEASKTLSPASSSSYSCSSSFSSSSAHLSSSSSLTSPSPPKTEENCVSCMELRQGTQTMQQALGAKSQLVDDLRRRLVGTERPLATARERFRQLQEQLDIVSQQRCKLQQQLELDEKLQAELRQEIATLTSSLARLQAEKTISDSVLAEERGAASGAKQNLQARVKALESEFAAYVGKSRHMQRITDKQIKETEKQLEQQKLIIRRATKQEALASQTIEELGLRLEKSLRSNKTLREDTAAMKSAGEPAVEAERKLRDQFKEIKEELDLVREESSSWRVGSGRRQRSLELDMQQVEEEKRKIQATLELFEKDAKKHKQELSEAKTALSAQEQILQEKETSIQVKTRIIEESQSCVHKLKSQFGAREQVFSETTERLKRRQNEYRERVEQLTEELRTVPDTQAMEVTIRQLNRQLEECHEESRVKDEALEFAQREVESVQAKLESRLQAIKKESDEKVAEIRQDAEEKQQVLSAELTTAKKVVESVNAEKVHFEERIKKYQQSVRQRDEEMRTLLVEVRRGKSNTSERLKQINAMVKNIQKDNTARFVP